MVLVIKTKFIGFVGYSNARFDKDKANLMIKEIFDSIDYKFNNINIVIVSGATSIDGIPKLVYDEAKLRNHKLMGIMAWPGCECELYDVDDLIIKGANWGDESDLFINTIDMLYRIGGGKQSFEEVKKASKKGIPIFEYDLIQYVDMRKEKATH